MKSTNTKTELGEILGQELAKWRGTTPLEDFVNADDLYRTLHPRLEELLAKDRQQLIQRIKKEAVDVERWVGGGQGTGHAESIKAVPIQILETMEKSL